jgi:hypothetical protein
MRGDVVVRRGKRCNRTGVLRVSYLQYHHQKQFDSAVRPFPMGDE